MINLSTYGKVGEGTGIELGNLGKILASLIYLSKFWGGHGAMQWNTKIETFVPSL